MEILSFSLVGKFAHFRAFYANSSNISHTIPPPTTIRGIIAAIIGIEKNKYHEELSNNKLRIAINIDSDIEKSSHKQNFLAIESDNSFAGSNGHTQIPLEIITPKNLHNDNICYKIYLDVVEPDFRHILYNKLKDRNPHFNITLGLANFSATITDVNIFSAEERNATNEIIEFDSAVLTKSISKIINVGNSPYHTETDILPIDFTANHSRALRKTTEVIFCRNQNKLKVVFSGDFYRITAPYNKIIQFIE